MEVIMKQITQFLLCVVFGQPPVVLMADETPAKEQSASELIRKLQENNPDKVCAAARALGRRKSPDTVPALKELLKRRSNSRIRWTAAEVLWRLEHRATDLVPVYMELLTSNHDIRAASAWRLGRLGSAARPAVLLLAGALRDESYEVRLQAGLALANLGPFAEPALPALVRALGDEQLDESRKANKGVESVRTSPAIPALVELADDAIPLLIESFHSSVAGNRNEETTGTPGWSVAWRVVHAFPAFGRRAVPPLLKALESKDKDTRRYAAAALNEMAQVNGLPQDAIDKLEQCLDDPEKDVRLPALSAVSWVRPASTRAVTVLSREKEDILRRSEGRAILERMVPHSETARKLLMGLLEDRNPETVQEAYRILAGLELPADQGLDLFTKALSHSNSNVRSQAIEALVRLGPAAKPAKSVLLERMKKDGGDIIRALRAIDPDDPELVRLVMADKSETLHKVRLLTELGQGAKDAIPWLEAQLVNLENDQTDGFTAGLTAKEIVELIARLAPDSARSAAALLKALGNDNIRSMHCPKNTWYMRDVLEDALQTSLPASASVLHEALRDRKVEIRQSVALVLLRGGLKTDAALPVLMDKLWSKTDGYGEQDRFQHRVVELLSRRRHSSTVAVAAAICKEWQAAHRDIRKILEPGLLVLQPEAVPLLLEQLRQAKTVQTKRELAHFLAHFEGQSKHVVPILREELREPSDAEQYEAAKALTVLGPEGAETVPELLQMLKNSHPGMRAVAARALGNVGRAARPAAPALKAMLRDAKAENRFEAASALSKIDPEASEALTFLCDEVTGQKHNGFIRFGTQIELPEGLKDPPFYFDDIEESILRFGERAALVLAELLDNVDLDEWSSGNVSAQCGANARLQAARLLARLGPEAKSAVPALVRALQDKDPFIRETAASALGRIGPAARKAAPDIIGLLEQQNRFASAAGSWSSSPVAGGRFRVASRYEYGGPFDFRTANRSLSRGMGFSYAFRDVDPYVGLRPDYPYDPDYVLSRIDGETRSAQPILSEMAKDPSHPTRLAAALALWRSGCDAPDLIPAFTAVLEAHSRIAQHENVPLPREVRECLIELDSQLKPAVRVMAQWLKKRQESFEHRDHVLILEALGRIGPAALSEMETIRLLLHGTHRKANRRVAVALALFRIGGEKDRVFPLLSEVLLGLEDHGSLYYSPDETDTARVHAARALGVLAESGDERARALIVETAKGDENIHVRLAALEALARQKQTNETAMKGLCALLRHPNDRVRAHAAGACGRLGTRAKSGVKALKAAVEDSHLAVRQAARQALEVLD
jgi:HEAT repeat protein